MVALAVPDSLLKRIILVRKGLTCCLRPAEHRQNIARAGF
jgi:hypothetical protein